MSFFKAEDLRIINRTTHEPRTQALMLCIFCILETDQFKSILEMVRGYLQIGGADSQYIDAAISLIETAKTIKGDQPQNIKDAIIEIFPLYSLIKHQPPQPTDDNIDEYLSVLQKLLQMNRYSDYQPTPISVATMSERFSRIGPRYILLAYDKPPEQFSPVEKKYTASSKSYTDGFIEVLAADLDKDPSLVASSIVQIYCSSFPVIVEADGRKIGSEPGLSVFARNKNGLRILMRLAQHKSFHGRLTFIFSDYLALMELAYALQSEKGISNEFKERTLQLIRGIVSAFNNREHLNSLNRNHLDVIEASLRSGASFLLSDVLEKMFPTHDIGDLKNAMEPKAPIDIDELLAIAKHYAFLIFPSKTGAENRLGYAYRFFYMVALNAIIFEPEDAKMRRYLSDVAQEIHNLSNCGAEPQLLEKVNGITQKLFFSEELSNFYLYTFINMLQNPKSQNSFFRLQLFYTIFEKQPHTLNFTKKIEELISLLTSTVVFTMDLHKSAKELTLFIEQSSLKINLYTDLSHLANNIIFSNFNRYTIETPDQLKHLSMVLHFFNTPPFLPHQESPRNLMGIVCFILNKLKVFLRQDRFLDIISEILLQLFQVLNHNPIIKVNFDIIMRFVMNDGKASGAIIDQLYAALQTPPAPTTPDAAAAQDANFTVPQKELVELADMQVKNAYKRVKLMGRLGIPVTVIRVGNKSWQDLQAAFNAPHPSSDPSKWTYEKYVRHWLQEKHRPWVGFTFQIPDTRMLVDYISIDRAMLEMFPNTDKKLTGKRINLSQQQKEEIIKSMQELRTVSDASLADTILQTRNNLVKNIVSKFIQEQEPSLPKPVMPSTPVIEPATDAGGSAASAAKSFTIIDTNDEDAIAKALIQIGRYAKNIDLIFNNADSCIRSLATLFCIVRIVNSLSNLMETYPSIFNQIIDKNGLEDLVKIVNNLLSNPDTTKIKNLAKLILELKLEQLIECEYSLVEDSLDIWCDHESITLTLIIDEKKRKPFSQNTTTTEAELIEKWQSLIDSFKVQIQGLSSSTDSSHYSYLCALSCNIARIKYILNTYKETLFNGQLCEFKNYVSILQICTRLDSTLDKFREDKVKQNSFDKDLKTLTEQLLPAFKIEMHAGQPKLRASSSTPK